MKLQGFAMKITTWVQIKDFFAPQTRVKDVLDNYELVKLVRIANNRERFRNVQIK